MELQEFDHIIIGSGIAGLSVAKNCLDTDRICLLTKGKPQESSTHYAQGGIAVALNTTDDTPILHYEDTITAGDGLCIEENVRILVGEGPARVQELIQLGIQFDREKDHFHFTKEGAHSRRRILHAKDATGKEMERVLYDSVKNHPNITLYDHMTVVRLLVHKNRCFGCVVVQNNQLITLLAHTVVIASGGCGQIYSHNTNPPMVTGDGIALAFLAGADVQDMEFIQFHPTTLYVGDKHPISIFLISEAIRGEGAILRNIHGERFMPAVHPLAELAPRDVVSRAIMMEMQRTQADYVFLDLSLLKDNIPERFPTIYQQCLEAEIDITKDFIPVVPAAHYFMGGIHTSAWGETTVRGLYAVGEASATGIHGANRLASNSLLDGLVFGFRVAHHIRTMPRFTSLEWESYKSIVQNIPSLPTPDIDPATKTRALDVKPLIRETMWQYVGIIRSQEGLVQAQKCLNNERWILNLKTDDPSIIEIQNMLIVSLLVIHFAISRTESRGAHYRIDYPDKDNQNWKIHQRMNISAKNSIFEPKP